MRKQAKIASNVCDVVGGMTETMSDRSKRGRLCEMRSDDGVIASNPGTADTADTMICVVEAVSDVLDRGFIKR